MDCRLLVLPHSAKGGKSFAFALADIEEITFGALINSRSFNSKYMKIMKGLIHARLYRIQVLDKYIFSPFQLELLIRF